MRLSITFGFSFQMAFILYYMAIVGHALSIVSLLISLAIFFYFRWVSIFPCLFLPIWLDEALKYLLHSCSNFRMINKPLDDGLLSCLLVFGRPVCCLLSNSLSFVRVVDDDGVEVDCCGGVPDLFNWRSHRLSFLKRDLPRSSRLTHLSQWPIQTKLKRWIGIPVSMALRKCSLNSEVHALTSELYTTAIPSTKSRKTSLWAYWLNYYLLTELQIIHWKVIHVYICIETQKELFQCHIVLMKIKKEYEKTIFACFGSL